MKRSSALMGLALALGVLGVMGGCQSASTDTAALKASLVFSHDAPSRQQIERGLRDGELIEKAAQEIAAAQRRPAQDVRQDLEERLQVSFKPGVQQELAVELRCKEEGLDEDYAKSWGRAAGLINALAERYVLAERAQREAGLRKQVFLARQKAEQAEAALRGVDNASLKGELAAAGSGSASGGSEAQELRQQIAALVADSGDPFSAKRAEKLRDRLEAMEAASAPRAAQSGANPAQVAQARAEYERARQRLAQAQAALDADIQGRWLQLTATAPVKPVEKPSASSVATRPFFEDQK